MRWLTAEQSRERCARAGVTDEVLAEGLGPEFGSGLEIAIPSVGLEILGLSQVLSEQLEERGGQRLVWLRTRDIWSEDTEALGDQLWYGLAALGGVAPGEVDKARGLLLEPEETAAEQAALSTVLLLQWDGVLLPEHARFVVVISHDGWMRLVARTPDTRDELEVAMRGWSPKRVTWSGPRATKEPR